MPDSVVKVADRRYADLQHLEALPECHPFPLSQAAPAEGLFFLQAPMLQLLAQQEVQPLDF